jgi:hypothetical protein
MKIILNRIKTPDGTIITSRHRHDCVYHTDANGKQYMVDGGCDYLRRITHDDAPYEEISIYEDSEFEVIRQHYCRGGRGKNGDQPLTWVPLCEMSDSWLSACIVYNEDRGLSKSFANSMYKKEIEYRKENEIIIQE